MLTRSVMIWRAERIADPLEKLRFLRTATRTLRQSRRWGRRASAFGLAGMVLVIVQFSVPTATSFWTRPLPPAVQGSTASAGKPPKVWLVERNAETEVYSNGLRVESKGSGTLHPRRYQPLDRARPETWRAEHNSVTTLRTEPAGIVFHTTESDLVPFDSTQNHQLQRLGQGILSFIRRNKSYHYLVDRFGRVHRVVDEASSANHAGWSVWADRRSIYLNLNHS
ncbi:MAG TPA: N-acetylmuramoyl-L-alanine amidase, partial [Bryobacteraceae bacterium]|nr:N-acetylmuramoyl-L-alanine amidase [Bryobacteraceae bacterium]